MKKSKIVVLLLSLALLFGVGNNNLKLDQNVGEHNRTIMKATQGPVSNEEGNITFGKEKVEIKNANVTAPDNNGNNWTITIEGKAYFEQNAAYSQVGSSNNPATSITFICTLNDAVAITSCSIKLGGFSGTAGDVSIKFGEDVVVSGKLNGTNAVTVESNTYSDSKKITISITNISKGVKVYSINYGYVLPDNVKAKADIKSSNTKAQLKYSFNVPQKEGVASFEKVTTAPKDWSGQYLIVYEAGNVAFDGSLTTSNDLLTTFDKVNNTQSVTIIDNKIEATDGMKEISFEIAKSGENYTIKSASGYYIGLTSNANELSSSKSTTYTNKISFNANSSVNIISSGGAYLRYNAASNQQRFRYFKSGSYTNQKEIFLYKLPEVKYSFFNMKMNLGAVIEAAKVQALLKAELSISSYGVAVAQKEKLGELSISDAVTNNNNSVVSIVSKAFESVDAMQKTDANGTETSGDYVIFNADLSFPDKSKYNVEVSAVAFFKLEDGTYVFFKERTLSVATLAQAYIENTEVYNTFDSNVQGSLKALAATSASVA